MTEITETRELDIITAEIITIKQHTQRMMLEASIEIGRRLCEAKEKVPFGSWGEYLAQQVDFSQSTANNLMRLYKEYGDDQLAFGKEAKSQLFGNLSYTQALALLALPEESREEVVAEHDMEEVTVAELREIIAEKEAALQAAAGELDKVVGSMEAAKKAVEKAEKEMKAAKIKADKMAAKVSSLESERDSLQQKLENAKEPDPEQLRLIREEAEQAASKAAESRVQEAEARADRAEKHMAAASMAETVEFKIHFEAMQQETAKMTELIARLAEKDQNTAERYKGAMIRYADAFRRQMEEIEV